MGTSAGVRASGSSRSLHVEKRSFRAGMMAWERATVLLRHSAAALRMAVSSPGNSPSDVYSWPAAPWLARSAEPSWAMLPMVARFGPGRRGRAALPRGRPSGLGPLQLVLLPDLDPRPHEVSGGEKDDAADDRIGTVHEVLQRRVL